MVGYKLVTLSVHRDFSYRSGRWSRGALFSAPSTQSMLAGGEQRILTYLCASSAAIQGSSEPKPLNVAGRDVHQPM
jgi:hypothetical protein